MGFPRQEYWSRFPFLSPKINYIYFLSHKLWVDSTVVQHLYAPPRGYNYRSGHHPSPYRWPSSPLATPNLISVSRSLFSSIFVCFLDSKYEWNLQYLSFSFWLIFHLTPSRPIHVLTKGRISFFLMAEEYPCVYVCVAYHIFFIYSSISDTYAVYIPWLL